MVLADGRAARREVEMRVLDGCHRDVLVLETRPALISWPWKISAIGICLPSAQRISAFGVR